MKKIRFHRKRLIIAGSILLIIILLAIFSNRILSNRADIMLRKELSSIDTSNYIIDYDKVRVNILSRSVSITDISVVPGQASIENVSDGSRSGPVFEILLRKARISSIGIMKLIRGEGIKVGRVLLSGGDITMYGYGSPFSKNSSDRQNGGTFSADSIQMPFDEGNIRSVKLDNIDLRYIDLKTGETSTQSDDIMLEVTGIHFGHPSGDTMSYNLDIGDISISMRKHRMELPGGFYSLSSGPLKASYEEGLVSIDSLAIIPAYPRGEFGKKFGKQTDRFDLLVGHIECNGIAWDSLSDNILMARQLKIDRIRADICRDKRVARDMTHFPKLFQTQIAELPLLASIGKISINDARLQYREILEMPLGEGLVDFDQVNINISGFCNFPDSIRAGQVLFADISARFNGQADCKLYLNLPIGNEAEYFTFHGTTGPFPATGLNPVISPLARIKTTGGKISSLSYYAMGMEGMSAGRMEFLYSDLEMDVLAKKDDDHEYHKNRFLSFVAKAALIKGNPHSDKPVRIAKMSYMRDPNKGQFNFIWKTIQDGLVITLTPGKKKLAGDMEWTQFRNNWRKVLMQDWQELQEERNKSK